MADDKYLGITFPVEEDLKGKYLKLNKIDKEQVKSNLSYLITTMKGERLYKPDFGTNLMQYLFEPMDEQTYNDIRNEIIGACTKYLREITIQKIETTVNESQLFVGLKVLYTISDGVFKQSDQLSLTF
jgi:phage baseplate assembly protein W